MSRAVLGTFVVLAIGADARAQYPTPTVSGVTFATYSTTPGARDCKLDVFIPATGTAPYPVLIYVHGGGWSTGGRMTPHPVWQGVLAQGIAVVTIDYRLTSQARQFGTVEGTPQGTYIPVVWPAQIHDCKAAVRWVRGNAAAYGLNTDRIGLFGTSAGGHLVAAMGTMGDVPNYTRGGQTIDMEGTVGNFDTLSSRVFAVCDFFGPTDILNMQLDVINPAGSLNHDVASSPESHLVGASDVSLGIVDVRANVDSLVAPYPQLAANTISANPITFARPGLPAMFIAHGSADTSVPTFQSNRLNTALLGSGNASKLTIVQGAGHGVLGTATNDAATAWLVGVLKDSLVCPSIAAQPSSKPACVGTGTSFSVSAAGTAPLIYRWRHNGVDIAGAAGASATFTISSAIAGDAGTYDCTVTNSCGSIRSGVATLTVGSGCAADFNCSGGGPTVQDIFDFLAAWFAGDVAADFDHAGGIGVSDIFAFLAAWFAGC